MPAAPNAVKYPPERKLGGGEPQEDEVKLIASSQQRSNPRCERPTRECCLEREGFAARGELFRPRQHGASRRDRGPLGRECRQASRDHIRVQELGDPQLVAKQEWSECGLAGPFGPASTTKQGIERGHHSPVGQRPLTPRTPHYNVKVTLIGPDPSWLLYATSP